MEDHLHTKVDVTMCMLANIGMYAPITYLAAEPKCKRCASIFNKYIVVSCAQETEGRYVQLTGGCCVKQQMSQRVQDALVATCRYPGGRSSTSNLKHAKPMAALQGWELDMED